MKSNNKFKKYFIPLILIILLNITSCVREEFDSPPSNIDDPEINLDANLTIKGLKELYNGADTMRITEDYIVEATIISSDRRGNFYKQIIVQDETGGIIISVDKKYIYETYPEGQKVYIKCKDLYLGESGGLTTLGHLFDDEEDGIIHGRMTEELADKHIIKSFHNAPIEPKTYTIEELKNGDSLTNTLIRIENVQFKASELGTFFADDEEENRYLFDTEYNEIILRTSEYSDFATFDLPTGSGSIVAVFGKYNSDYQLYIKYTDWINFNAERFYDPYFKDFNDQDLYSDGWTTQLIIGEKDWEVDDLGSDSFYAKMSNYGGSPESETWLISPSFNLTTTKNPVLNFQSAWGYSGSDMIVRYSIDYDGTSEPNTATWTDLNPNYYTGSDWWTWTDSGNLELPKESNVYVAFIYIDDTNCKTWEIDNIGIIDTN